jgi:hypothetical protein
MKVKILFAIIVILGLTFHGFAQKDNKPKGVKRNYMVPVKKDMTRMKKILEKKKFNSFIRIHYKGKNMTYLSSRRIWTDANKSTGGKHKGYFLFLKNIKSKTYKNSAGILLKELDKNKYYPIVSFKINGVIRDVKIKSVSLRYDKKNKLIYLSFKGLAGKRKNGKKKHKVSGFGIGYVPEKLLKNIN